MMSLSAGGTLVEPDFSSIWEETRSAQERMSFTAGSYYTECISNPGALERVSFFLIQVIYQVTFMLIRLSGSSPGEQTRQNIDTSKRLLSRIDVRWKLAGKCLGDTILTF